MEKTKDLKNLKLDEEIDGVSFFICDETSTEDRIEWNFTLMDVKESVENVSKHSLGYKYQIVLYDKDKEIEIFEAIIGDLDHYVKNLVKINQEGFILKKSKKSEEILNKIFRKRLMSSLTNVLEAIAEKKKIEAL